MSCTPSPVHRGALYRSTPKFYSSLRSVGERGRLQHSAGARHAETDPCVRPACRTRAAQFTWTVENFGTVKQLKLYSPVFQSGQYNWRILLFPNGNNVQQLSVYLDVADSVTLPQGWSRQAHFSLTVQNQKDPSKSVVKGAQNYGCCSTHNEGCSAHTSRSACARVQRRRESHVRRGSRSRACVRVWTPRACAHASFGVRRGC